RRSIGGLAHDRDLALGAKERANAFADGLMIVGDEYADHGGELLLALSTSSREVFRLRDSLSSLGGGTSAIRSPGRGREQRTLTPARNVGAIAYAARR